MKTAAVVALALAMPVLLAPPDAGAQALGPKVTISGYIDVKNSAYNNISLFDSDPTFRDTGWHTSTRGVFRISGEVGKAKGVLALEMDLDWGQTGAADTDGRSGTDGGSDLDTDIQEPFEIKSLYVEFPVPGWPFPATLTLGLQPHRETFSHATLVHTDFPGVRLSLAPAPNIKWDTIFIQAEEALAGARFGFTRGEDWAVVSHVTVTPFKGLDVKPIYAYLLIDGPISGFARDAARGGIPLGPGDLPFNRGVQENRHTAGFDAMWRVGPWYLTPTFFYQWGDRELRQGGIKREQDISAWFADVRGGWRAGPLLLEALAAYTPGNEAGDNLGNNAADPRRHRATINYYQPISSTAYGSGWGLILGSNDVDFLVKFSGALGSARLISASQPTYDRYGLIWVVFRPSYDVTPALRLQGLVGTVWTDEKVDTNSALVGARTANAAIRPFDGRGDSRYVGTEVNARLVYRFAPGLEYTLAGGYLFPGDALDNGGPTGGPAREAKDVWIVSQKVTFRF